MRIETGVTPITPKSCCLITYYESSTSTLADAHYDVIIEKAKEYAIIKEETKEYDIIIEQDFHGSWKTYGIWLNLEKPWNF